MRTKRPVKATWEKGEFQRGCRGSQSHALVAWSKLPNLSSIHSMKYPCFALFLLGALTTMSPAIAASASMPRMGAMHAGSMNGTTATAAVSRGFMAHGVVNSVDVAAGSVNSLRALNVIGLGSDRAISSVLSRFPSQGRTAGEVQGPVKASVGSKREVDEHGP